MASVVVDPKAVRAFASQQAFEAWLAKNHDRAAEVWIKIYKKGSGKPSIDPSEAIDSCLCWGWIDAIRKSLDDEAFLQRYTPRGKKSRWSQINRERVAKLVKAGRMTPHGQTHVDAAKADGRWDAAYPSAKATEVPPEFLKAVNQVPKARAVFRTLNRQNTYAIAYRYHNLKTPAGRAQFIARWVEQLSRGELPHAQAVKVAKKPAKKT
ncbi:MAG: hypothetical protein K0R38_5628 [Polyangiaceae bacterium]|jgi:uncharacterized protein YdeI (YjbR/CyaY-like superfamily)|nr:hypothetical protein [Polyangiaceae bacterium]